MWINSKCCIKLPPNWSSPTCSRYSFTPNLLIVEPRPGLLYPAPGVPLQGSGRLGAQYPAAPSQREGSHRARRPAGLPVRLGVLQQPPRPRGLEHLTQLQKPEPCSERDAPDQRVHGHRDSAAGKQLKMSDSIIGT